MVADLAVEAGDRLGEIEGDVHVRRRRGIRRRRRHGADDLEVRAAHVDRVAHRELGARRVARVEHGDGLAGVGCLEPASLATARPPTAARPPPAAGSMPSTVKLFDVEGAAARAVEAAGRGLLRWCRPRRAARPGPAARTAGSSPSNVMFVSESAADAAATSSSVGHRVERRCVEGGRCRSRR